MCDSETAHPPFFAMDFTFLQNETGIFRSALLDEMIGLDAFCISLP